ncbi:MAG: hypothetical protein HZB61_11820 [Nitrospirae bacterium]|nr:hypothetical protein [Nitrospirota bacterium]
MELTDVVASNGQKLPALKIEGVEYTSTFEYLRFGVNDFIYDYPVELEIRLNNNDSMPTKALMVNATLKYDYRTRGGGRVGASGYEKGRFTLMPMDIPVVGPNSNAIFKFKTKSIRFEEPPIDNTAILLLEIRDVKNGELIDEASHSVKLITRSSAEDQIRGTLTFWIVIATFFISLITLLFSWSRKSESKEIKKEADIVQDDFPELMKEVENTQDDSKQAINK